MKKITLFIATLSFMIGSSQNLITNGDFSNGAAGWALTPTGSIVNGEAFFSSTNSAGNPWDTELKREGLSFTNAASYTLTFKARAVVARSITVAIQNTGIWNDQFRQNFAITTTMATYTATFNATSTNAAVQLGFLMGGFGVTHGVYIDDVVLNGPPPVVDPAPVVAAPTPPARPAADVISLFSDAYTNTTITTWGADWGPEAATITDNPIAGNATKKVNLTSGKTFAGTILASNQDLTSFTHFHIDYWIPSPLQGGQVLSFKLSNHDATPPATGESSAIQTLPAPQGGQWVSVDVPLANFTAAAANGILARNKIKEFVLSAARTNNSVALPFYFDNLYFHKNTLSSNEFTKNSVSIYPNPVQDVLTINTQETLRNVNVFNINGQQMPVRLNNNTIDVSSFSNGVYLLNVELENGSKEVIKFVK